MRHPLRTLTMKRFLTFFLFAPIALAGSFPGVAGTNGSDALSKDDPAFISWARGNLTPIYGTEVDDKWKTPQKAYGMGTTNTSDIVCLGNGGQIVMTFPKPIRDGGGADFAVFENSFNHTFLELAFVEVSSDGLNYYRFPNRSEGTIAVGAFGNLDPTNLSGLAGKYRAGFGTPFDLAALASAALLDRQNVRFVRIVDIIGDGATFDSSGQPIYDPTPTLGSGGFDLEAIGVIHENDAPCKVVRAEVAAGAFQLAWESNPGTRYQLDSTTDLVAWTSVGTVTAAPALAVTSQALTLDGAAKRFWRVRRLD
jgi:hypothetical protein